MKETYLQYESAVWKYIYNLTFLITLHQLVFILDSVSSLSFSSVAVQYALFCSHFYYVVNITGPSAVQKSCFAIPHLLEKQTFFKSKTCFLSPCFHIVSLKYYTPIQPFFYRNLFFFSSTAPSIACSSAAHVFHILYHAF